MLTISGIQEGFVLDHIQAGKCMEIYKYLNLDKLDCCVAIIKNARSKKLGKKDIMKIECPIDVIDLDILGFIDHNITVNIIKDEKIIEYFKRVTDEFVKRLPEDSVPYWDMIFTDGSGEPRDTSAAAIAACGIMEMNKYIDCSKYQDAVDKMLESLAKKYTSKNLEKSNVILTDAMYSRPDGHKPEGAIYGDYFYMEALMRKINPDWKRYW